MLHEDFLVGSFVFVWENTDLLPIPSLPGSPPTFEQARVLRTRLEKAWRLFNLRGDYKLFPKLLDNAANYYLLFGGQKVFLMAGRSPLKCDNSH